MVFVNDPGDWSHVLAPFDHAEWNGFTPTDAIFPFFLFISGTAGALSLARRAEQAGSTGSLARRALARGAAIVLIGWALAWLPFTLERLHRLRIPGVLPRIGVVFALGTLLVLAAKRSAGRIALAAALLLAVHSFLLTGTGFGLTRGDNVQRAVDLALLKGHLWKPDWDPEGIVSTLSSIATFLTGTLAGLWILRTPERRRRDLGLAAAGAACALAGVALAPLLPVNKNLWTASYVLLSSGLAALLLAIAFVLEERGGAAHAGFFLTFGRNPLLAFVASGLLAKTLLLVKVAGPDGKKVSLWTRSFRAGFSWVPDRFAASHLFALAFVLVVYAIVRAFERRGIYWKV